MTIHKTNEKVIVAFSDAVDELVQKLLFPTTDAPSISAYYDEMKEIRKELLKIAQNLVATIELDENFDAVTS